VFVASHDSNVEASRAFGIFSVNSARIQSTFQLLDDIEMSMVDRVVKAVEPLRIQVIDLLANRTL